MMELWFPTPIWSYQINADNILFEDAVEYCLQTSKNLKSEKKSNIGGWQSESLWSRDIKDTPLEYFKEEIQKLIYECCKNLNIEKFLKISNMWINVNGKDHYNETHNHPTSVLSGVLYLSDENSRICFERERDYMYKFLADSYAKSLNPVNFTTISYTPKKGTVLIFPSWLDHYVEKNENFNKRISVAFNTFDSSIIDISKLSE